MSSALLTDSCLDVRTLSGQRNKSHSNDPNRDTNLPPMADASEKAAAISLVLVRPALLDGQVKVAHGGPSSETADASNESDGSSKISDSAAELTIELSTGASILFVAEEVNGVNVSECTSRTSILPEGFAAVM